MKQKLNFFDWYETNEKLPHEEHNTEWIENYVKKSVWENEPIHFGDCTNHAITCPLCSLTDLLIEYREYYFDKE